MKKLCTPILALSLMASPAIAQDSTPDPDMGEGLNLMEEGARLLLRGLLSEMDPAIQELQGLALEMGPKMRLFAEEMGPAFAELMAQVDDITNYTAPEFLPNGDIIIRRKPEAPGFVLDDIDDNGEVEL